MIFSDTEEVDELIPSLSQKKKVTLILSGVLILDVSGAKELLELCEQLHAHGVFVKIEGESESVGKMLERSGVCAFLAEQTAEEELKA